MFMHKHLVIFCCFFICLSSFAQSPTGKSLADRNPFVLGSVEKLYSSILKEERTLNIYLPDSYTANDTAHYPIIYLLDGSRDEDFIHIAGLVQFCSFEWVHILPPSIVVGIATVDRRRDFTFETEIESDKKRYPTTGHSEKFIQFIKDELQPYIESNYRTAGSKTLIGQSLGGLLATEILFKHPDIFNKYIIVSPSLWWNNGSLLAAPLHALSQIQENVQVFIGVGKEGLTPTEIPRVMEVDANLLVEKLKGVKNNHLQVFFDYLPQEDHATIMHQAVYNAFRVLQ